MLKQNKFQRLFAALLSAIVIVSFTLTSCSKDDDNDEKKETKSLISQINITKYQYALGERASFGKKYETHIFDENGLLTQSKMFHIGVHDDVEYVIDYKYDNALITRINTLTLNSTRLPLRASTTQKMAVLMNALHILTMTNTERLKKILSRQYSVIWEKLSLMNMM